MRDRATTATAPVSVSGPQSPRTYDWARHVPRLRLPDEAQLLPGMRQARQAIGRGELVVIPTDTVYGIAADAFNARAVQRLLEAKGRGRQSPPPVLVAGRRHPARAGRGGARAGRASSSRRSGRAASPSCCRPSRRWPGTSATPRAPSPCACRRPHRPRTARGDRAARRVERQPDRHAAGDRRRRRAGDARRQRRGLPRRRVRPATGDRPSTIVDATSRRSARTRRTCTVLRDGAIVASGLGGARRLLEAATGRVAT